MTYTVDFQDVSTTGLESSPVAEALAGLRANEARYFRNKYDHVFTVQPAPEAPEVVEWVHGILQDERGLDIDSEPLEATAFEVDRVRMAYVFYESGLSVNVMYAIDEDGKRAVGFKLSEGMEVPGELAERFKFARQKSKLAGTIRGSFFVIKGSYSGLARSLTPANSGRTIGNRARASSVEEPVSAPEITRASVGLRSERGPILLAVMLSIGLVAIDSTILATAVPAVVDDLGGFTSFPWLFSIYLLAQAVSVPIYGKVADLVRPQAGDAARHRALRRRARCCAASRGACRR